MTDVTLISETAASTTEGAPGSQPAAEAAATAAAAAPAATPEAQQGAPAAGDKPAGEVGAAEGQGGDKPAGDKPAAEGKEGEPAKTEAAPQGAPEAYAEFSVPEGVTLDPELTTGLTAIAKELNLPQAQAQRLVDLGVKQAQAIAAAQTNQLATARTTWAAETQADTEIGGDKLQATVANARKALTTFGTPALKTLLDQSGLGNHPEIVRVFAKAGAAISEDALLAGRTGGGGGPVDAAAKLYPDQN